MGRAADGSVGVTKGSQNSSRRIGGRGFGLLLLKAGTLIVTGLVRFQVARMAGTAGRADKSSTGLGDVNESYRPLNPPLNFGSAAWTVTRDPARPEGQATTG